MCDMRLAAGRGTYSCRLCYMVHLVSCHYSVNITGSHAGTGLSVVASMLRIETDHLSKSSTPV